jgi:hypothetical protein
MHLNLADLNLNQTEGSLLLCIVGGLLVIVGTFISIIWVAANKKLSSIDSNVGFILINQRGFEKDIEGLKDADERLEEKVDRIDIRVERVERKLGGFMAPPRQQGI